jgi:predicted nuclease of predicted toxin-antitoxin system
MRFLIDAQLPPALAVLLTKHGHIAEHVADIGLRHAACG